MADLVFATNNLHKVNEIKEILGTAHHVVTLAEAGLSGDIPEDQDTLEGNASQKSHFLHSKSGMDCFADDTGLEVNQLNGAPGVFSARFAELTGERRPEEDASAANIRKLLKLMEGSHDRRARFRTVISLIISGKEYQFEGIVEGSILESPKGESGFGYDPVFLPQGYTNSFAEMPLDEKNKISHRARAIAKLQDFLKKTDAG